GGVWVWANRIWGRSGGRGYRPPPNFFLSRRCPSRKKRVFSKIIKTFFGATPPPQGQGVIRETQEHSGCGRVFQCFFPIVVCFRIKKRHRWILAQPHPAH